MVLNAFQLPHGIGYTELHDRLKDRGFIIYAGQGDLATTLFRVSAMGAIAVADMERFVDAVREAIRPEKLVKRCSPCVFSPPRSLNAAQAPPAT